MLIPSKIPPKRIAHWLSGWPKKSPNFVFTTKMVFPKSLKFMNSGSQIATGRTSHGAPTSSTSTGPKTGDLGTASRVPRPTSKGPAAGYRYPLLGWLRGSTGKDHLAQGNSPFLEGFKGNSPANPRGACLLRVSLLDVLLRKIAGKPTHFRGSPILRQTQKQKL